MTARPSREERLLLDLCRALDAAMGDRRHNWCSHLQLAQRLPALTTEQLDLAIGAAAQKGWLEAAGKPPHSVRLTAAGRDAIGEA